MKNPVHALQVLRHPAWIAALALLIANDHIFKGAGLLPGGVTGKLSDLAGFFMFPFLLTALARRRTRLGALVCHGLAAALLFAIELSPALCALLHRTIGLHMWADPTDLIALAAIAASWIFLLPIAEQAPAPRRAAVMPWFSRAMVVVGALASMATSRGRGPLVGTMYLYSQREQPLQVRVSVLKKNVDFDCAAAMARPELVFAPAHFTVARHVAIEPKKTLRLDDLSRDAKCHVLWVAVEGYRERLVMWTPGSLPSVQFEMEPETGSGVRIPNETRELDSAANVLYPVPPAEPDALPVSCVPPSEAIEPDWSAELPRGATWNVQDVQKGSDGCDLLVLTASSQTRHYTVCAEPIGVPFVAGDKLNFRDSGDGTTGIVIESTQGMIKTLILTRRAPVDSVDSRDCTAARKLCGTAEAVRARIKTPFGISAPLGSGEEATLTAGVRTVRVAVTRAEKVLLTDRTCDSESRLGNLASYVMLIQ